MQKYDEKELGRRGRDATSEAGVFGITFWMLYSVHPNRKDRFPPPCTWSRWDGKAASPWPARTARVVLSAVSGHPAWLSHRVRGKARLMSSPPASGRGLSWASVRGAGGQYSQSGGGENLSRLLLQLLPAWIPR